MEKKNSRTSSNNKSSANYNTNNISNNAEKVKASLEKPFELLAHLKTNIKNYHIVCDIHESDLTDYCLFCKQSICEVCVQTIHNCHPVVNKDSYPMNSKYYETLFNDFEKEVKNIEESIQPTQLLKTFKKNVEIEMNDLIDKLNDVKIKRLKEIDSMFISTGYDCKQLKNAIKVTKDTIYKYINKNKSFLDLKTTPDSDSYIFLQNYEIANDCNTKIKNYIKLINQIRSTYASISQGGADNKFVQVSKLIDNILLEQKKKDIQKANSKVWQALDDNGISKDSLTIPDANESPRATTGTVSRKLMEIYNKINEDNFISLREKLDSFDQFQDNFKTLVYESVKRNQSLNEINKIVNNFEQKIAKKIILGGGTRKINLNQSTLKSKSQLNSSGSSKSKVYSTHLSQATSHSKKKIPDKEAKKQNTNNINSKVEEKPNIEDNADFSEDPNTKKDSQQQHSDGESDEQIDVNMKLNAHLLEQRKDISRVIDRVFKPKQKIKNLKVVSKQNMEMKKQGGKPDDNKDKYKVNVELQNMIKENEKICKQLSNKEKVSLNVPIIRKYYSFNFLDYVRNTYQKIINALNSHNDKSILELYDLNTIDNDPYKQCSVKVIEGTDEIQIYNKSQKKIQKIKVEFDIKKLNTKVFYKGCKSYHTQGKVYISGGKDFNGDKQLFMVYNIAEKKLSRLHDMKYPRSFHTFVYNETMRALLAIGGENNNSCELYDFYLNMWNDFPELNYPRANVDLILNQNATLAYAMFGIVGDMVHKQISDVVEVIDMIDLNKGWYKVEYTNKTGIDIKSNLMTIEKLPDEKLLMFGGLEQRNPNPLYLLFDLKNFEMSKVDLRQAEMMKKMENKNEQK